MNIKKIGEAIHKLAPNIKVEEYKGCVRLSGESDSWETIYKCGDAAVTKKSLGVLNDIKLTGFSEEIKVPSFSDSKLDGMSPDVLVIGGGIVGCAIARELARLNLNILLVDKANDVATASSSRNDGCIHVGMDLRGGQQKLKYVLWGNSLYDNLAKELGLSFRRWAQIFIFAGRGEKFIIGPVYRLRAAQLHIKGVRYISTAELNRIEPSPPKWAKGAMYMASGGVVSPYKTAIALADNAIENGAHICLNTMVLGMDVENGVIKAVHTSRGTIRPKVVVNAAGCFSDIIADMAGDRTFTIHPRKGTDIILDKKKVHYALSSFARSFFTPMPLEAQPLVKKTFGHTKGGGVMRTVDGNILVGPDAEETPFREDTTTSIDAIDAILRKQKLVASELSRGDVITYFAGLRAATYEEDFVVRRGIFTRNIYEAAGIQSPGITAAPAIAIELRNWIKADLGVGDNRAFNPNRAHTPRLADADEKTREKYIAKNAAYGEIICRCEEVSRGEIIDALEQPLRVATLDGIKRRVRPGMGRCQGGFCSPLVAAIIAEHEHISIEDVIKGEGNSKILFGNTKNPTVSVSKEQSAQNNEIPQKEQIIQKAINISNNAKENKIDESKKPQNIQKKVISNEKNENNAIKNEKNIKIKSAKTEAASEAKHE